jgi:hypothetical protein
MQSHSPFPNEASLRNLATGDIEVSNSDQLHEIGEEIIDYLNGKEVFDVTMKRSCRAKTIADQLKMSNEKTIDPRCDALLQCTHLIPVVFSFILKTFKG